MKDRIRVISSLREMRSWGRVHGNDCGLVPTLGALHEGHRSLIKKARSENRLVAVSVFVNPLQFRKKQYRLYPRNLAADIILAKEAGADIVFAPDPGEMYPLGSQARIILPALFKRLRPQKLEWHYKGVLTVVMKLFQLVRPRRAYFGLKDPHQLALIEKMVADLNVPVEIRKCPTIREKDGLARSSRNRLLTPAERSAARVICRALEKARDILQAKGTGSSAKAIAAAKRTIADEKLAAVDHIEVIDPLTLAPLGSDAAEALVFIAAWIGNKRLTDNVRLRLKRSRSVIP